MKKQTTKRRGTKSSADLMASLASNEYIKLAPDRLDWPRPVGRVMMRPRNMLELPASGSKPERMTWGRWTEALGDFVGQYVGELVPALQRPGDVPSNLPHAFAQKYGLLQAGSTMSVEFFNRQQKQLREFDRAVRLQPNSIPAITDKLETEAPPIKVTVRFESHRGGNTMLLIPQDLLSGLWIVAIRASAFKAPPVRKCALAGCDNIVTGRADAYTCSPNHKQQVRRKPELDKRRTLKRLEGIGNADFESLVDAYHELQRRHSK